MLSPRSFECQRNLTKQTNPNIQGFQGSLKLPKTLKTPFRGNLFSLMWRFISLCDESKSRKISENKLHQTYKSPHKRK